MKTQKHGGGKKAKNNWSTTIPSGGMRKHARSGHAHNHAITIMRVREENERLVKEARIREKKKGKMFSSVREVFEHATS